MLDFSKNGDEDADADAAAVQVTELMHETCVRTKMKAEDFKFKPARTWLGGQATEKIEGWPTRIYEASGKMNAVTTFKVRGCEDLMSDARPLAR